MYLYDLLKDKKYDDFIRQTSLYLKKTSFDLQIREYFINQLSPIGDSTNLNIQLKILNGFIRAIRNVEQENL